WGLILERATAEEVYPLFYRNLEVLIEKQGVESSEQGAVNRRSKTAGQRSEARGQKAETGGPLSQRIDEACQKLQKFSRINAFRNALLTEELVRLLTLLAEAGIPTIPLKGVVLAESLYGYTAARVCNDIDILVPRRHVREAFRIIFAAGFEP